jgi:uncharacterized protein YndB with AHSA1/START domain
MAAKKSRIKLTSRVYADAISLYDSLTNPRTLAIWFCNKAKLSLKVRGPVHFSGDNCVASSFPEKEIKGVITELDPNRLIRYTWPIAGVESEVMWEIYDKGHYCNLVLTHSKIPENSQMMDAWIIYLYNLRSFIKDGRPTYRFDYTAIDKRTIKRELFFDVLPPAVFRALTDQESLRVWFAKEAEVEPKVGGKYISGWKDKKGRPAGPTSIEELVENKKLVYGWQSADEGKSGDLVTWELTRIGEKTRVTLKHSGFAPERDNKDYAQGWHAYILTLKDFCESRGRLSFQVLDGDWLS